MTKSRVRLATDLFVVFALMQGVAFAQSAITGEVKDASSAILPGVTVEASSPALIERTRSVVTDGQGRYSIVDLRPGIYAITYTLPGFSIVRRENFELPSNFTATINVELRVGALEETLTVTGSAPAVDVQSAGKSQVLSKAVLDAVPTGRSVWGYAQLVVGASSSQPDVGGSKGLHYPAPSLRGVGSNENSYQLDGLIVSTVNNAPQYFNTQQVQEMVYQTSGLGAELSGGGLRINMIPKEGGNTFSADFFGSYMVHQGDNFSEHLRSKGMGGVDTIDKIWDFNPGVGGPIRRDKLWFYSSYRWWGMNQPIAGSFWADGRQAIDDNNIKDGLVRLTWHMTPRNKLAAYYDRQDKFRGHDTTAGVDPATASTVWTSPNYSTQTLKWTSAVSSRLLIEAGYNATFQDFWQTMQPGILKARGTPEWFAGAAHRDLSLGTVTNARDGISLSYNHRKGFAGSASYVTGSHNVKAGFSYQFGAGGGVNDGNADLAQQYRNGIPDSVVVKNTPVLRRGTNQLKADLGIYVQDSWTLKRLTVNAGVRWEYFNGMVKGVCSPAGRFVAERCFEDVEDVPNWKDWAPRLGLAYDLFGNARTALKFGLNRFNQQAGTSFPGRYDPAGAASATLRWTDLNGDNIAQGDRGCAFQTVGCEIDFSTLPANFGVRRLNRLDPSATRPYSYEVSAQLQHEIIRGLSLSLGWFRRSFKNDIISTDLNRTFEDFTPLTVVSPTNGEVITIYNITRIAAGRANDIIDTNQPDDADLAGRWATSLEATIGARLPKGATLNGGVGFQRAVVVSCYSQDNPNSLRFCDQRENDMPYRMQLKLSGMQPLPWGLQVAANIDSEPGVLIPGQASGSTLPSASTENVSFWRLTRTTRYGANCTGPCTPGALVVPTLTQASLNVPLNPPGSEWLERFTGVDVSLSRTFGVGRMRILPQLDVFNALNVSPVHRVRSIDITAATYMVPWQTVPARMIRLATRITW